MFPVPIGTIISESCFMEQMAVFPQPSEIAESSHEPFYSDLMLEYPTTVDMNPIAIPCSSSSLDCVVFGNSTSGAHTCTGCYRYIHVPCGRSNGEEGYGTSVWCSACEIRMKNKECDNVGIGITRNQENLHRRMINATSNKLKHAEIGNSVVIPI